MTLKNNQRDDVELFIRFQRGDPAAFRTIYERHQQKMRLNIYPLVGQMEVAEDIVADAFLKLFFNRRKVNDAAHIFGYLFIIARNQAIGYLREEKRQREADEAQERLVEKGYIDPIGSEAEKEQIMEKINGLIGQLPPARKRIFRLYFFDGLDIRTIAKRLNLTETTVRNQKNRALTFLRETLTR